MTDEQMRAFSRELQEGTEESRRAMAKLDELSERRMRASQPCLYRDEPSRSWWEWPAVAVMFVGCVALLASAWAWGERVTFERPTPDEFPRIVYVPRCSPAFAGRALVCIDAPVAKTFSTTEAP